MGAADLVQVGAVGKHGVLGAPGERQPRVLVLRDLPAIVNADGANGPTRGTRARAKELGLWMPPGVDQMPLAAYHPKDFGPTRDWTPPRRGPLGLDAPESGGNSLTDAWGWLVVDGSPALQGPRDPAPGYLVSTTALRDHRLPETDPVSYFDSAGAPGWTLPARDLQRFGVQLGDLARVTWRGVSIWAQAFDEGHPGGLVELSVYACSALGMPDCGRSGGVPNGVDITILPRSRVWILDHLARPRPGTPAEIERAASLAAHAAGLE